jgi:hypothetical protein
LDDDLARVEIDDGPDECERLEASGSETSEHLALLQTGEKAIRRHL